MHYDIIMGVIIIKQEVNKYQFTHSSYNRVVIDDDDALIEVR